MFRIKDGYQENPGPKYFVDEPQGALVYQPNVLWDAEQLAIELGVTKIVDVGCGWAEKLAALHERQPEWDLIGIDFGENLNHCRETYDWGTWSEVDLERPAPYNFAGAIVVVSDVIEHLVDPTAMLYWLKFAAPTRVIFSTPERDLQNGPDHMGPCSNPYHVREWNLAEFVAFLEDEQFTIECAGLTQTCAQGPEYHTILVVAITP